MPTERNSEERSDEESLVQRALEERAARTARRAVNLLLLTMLTLGEAVRWVARIFRVSKALSESPRGPFAESTAGAQPSSPRAAFLYPVEKNGLGRLVLAFTSEAPR